jgi:hypothetical protein
MVGGTKTPGWSSAAIIRQDQPSAQHQDSNCDCEKPLSLHNCLFVM